MTKARPRRFLDYRVDAVEGSPGDSFETADGSRGIVRSRRKPPAGRAGGG